MSISSLDDLIEKTVILMGGITDDISPDALELAAGQAVSETAWPFPIAVEIKSFWIIERTRRHILQILLNIAAMKFQYKQIHLEHRFKHLIQLVEKMDADFSIFVEENPELFLAAFAGADADLDGFLTYIVNGFVYDASGIEV